jgi:hypothetical protein
MRILIGLPSYPGVIKTDCVISLLGLQRALLESGIPADFAKNQPADVVLARNIFASRIVNESRYTHLLFVDNDMRFNPSAVIRLIDASKPIIGCIYPKKNLQLAFAVRTLPGQTELSITDGMCVVAGIGMGLCLIQKTSLDALLSTRRIRASSRHGKEFALLGPLYGFFDPLPALEEPNEMLPEDFSFCERWRGLCNGEVWAVADEDVDHIGEFTYRGNYVEFLKSRSAGSSSTNPTPAS